MYKFRFVTASLLAEYKSLSSPAVMNSALKILLDQQYIGRKYDKSYKLQGKGAVYYLAPKALTYLRDEYGFHEQVLHAMYKNKSVSPAFIEHNLTVFRTYLALRDSYPDTFHAFTKYELATYDYFPEPKPTFYLNRIKPLADGHNEYMLDIFVDTPAFVMKKRFAAVVEHYESGDWEAEAQTDYPTILFVYPDSKGEERLQAHIAKTLDNTGIDDLTVYTTTVKALTSKQDTTWTDTLKPQKLMRL